MSGASRQNEVVEGKEEAVAITQQWLKAWAGQYPASEDAKLEPLRGREHFTKEEAAVVVGWKSPRTTSRFAKNSDGSVVELTRRAFRVKDELGAVYAVALNGKELQEPVSLILSSTNLGFAAWAAAEPSLVVGPGVAIVRGQPPSPIKPRTRRRTRWRLERTPASAVRPSRRRRVRAWDSGIRSQERGLGQPPVACRPRAAG
jgi:hypothetical protein